MADRNGNPCNMTCDPVQELRDAKDVLESIVDAYVARSEIFTSDAECAANLHDRAAAYLERHQ